MEGKGDGMIEVFSCICLE